MVLNMLFDNYDLLIDSPNSTVKMRKLILQLAVHGKLVEQDPNDEPAGELLKRIKAEKEKLIAEGKIKKQKPLPPINEDEIPYELPQGWEWARLQELSIKITDGEHLSPRKTDSGVLLLTAKHVTKTGVVTEDPQFVSPEDAKLFRQRCDPEMGDILICSRGTIGRCTVVDIDNYFCLMGSVILMKPLRILYERYLMFALCTDWAQQWMLSSSGATAVKALYLKDIKNCPIPLPPLSEQKRIVAKVDQLMHLCDQLDACQKKASTKYESLNDAALERLLSSKTTDEFANHWQFLCNNFDLIYNDPTHVNKLRQAILQLAVQGKLAPQDLNDEPASELLKRIKAEKEKLIAEGKIKKQKPLPPITEDEIPFELPEGWELIRLGNISNRIGSGSTPRGGKSVYTGSGIPFLRSQNVWDHGLELSDVAYIPEEIHQKMSNTVVQPNDVLLNITGASLGRCTIYPDGLGEANVSQHVTIIRPTDAPTSFYLHLCLLSPYIQELVWGRQVGMAREGLSKKVLELFEIPLPPLAEQKRIVAKVDQLMNLCDELETRLNQSKKDSEMLMQAVLYEAFS